MSSAHRSVYRFAGFELDAEARRLAGRHGEVALQPRPFDVLQYLIEHRDRVVPRAELVREVWGSHVGPQALRYAIHAIRKALADDGAQQQVLRTVRGSGVQFVAPLEVGPSLLTGEHLSLRRAEAAPFLGRKALLASAAESLDAARSGQGGVLLLEGEAGIGKSRAIEEFAAMAFRAGFQVFGGRCAVGEGEPAFAPWRQVVRAVAGKRSVRDLAEELEVRTADLAWIAAPMEESYDLAEENPWRNQATRARLFDHVAELIVRASHDTPVFLSIDDVHRSDPASLALLAHLAPLLSQARVWLIASFRKSDRMELTDLLSSLEGGVEPSRLQRHELGGLDPPDIKELVESLTNVEIDPALARALEQRTGGNPFFATLLINVLKTQERIGDLAEPDLEALALPERVYDAVLLQLRDLKPETIEILELASTAGREFSSSDLVGALEGVSEEQIAERLEPAVSARVLAKESLPGSYRFVHALVQESILVSLDEPRRIQFHARIAHSIEAQVKGSEWLRASELAHHFLEAAPLTGTDSALHYLEAAADWASLNMGFEDAVGFLEIGVTMRKSMPSVPCECRFLIKLGGSRNRLGRRGEARVAFLDSVAIARRAKLPQYFAFAALAFSPDFFSLETGIVDADQVALLKEALANPAIRNPALLAQLAARLGVALHWSDEGIAKGHEFAELGLSLARQSGDAYSTAFAETAHRFATFEVDKPLRLTELPRTDFMWAEPAALLIGRVLRLTGYWLIGEIGMVRAELEEFALSSRQLHEIRAEWYEWLWKAALALMEGNYRRAFVFQERYFELGSRAGDRNAAHSRLLQSFLTSVDVSEVEPFGEPILDMIEQFPRVSGWRAGRLHYAIEAGLVDEAASLFTQLEHERVIEKPKRNEWYGLAAAMAIAAARLKLPRSSEHLYEVLEEQRERFAVIGYGSYCYGSVAQLLGLCAWGAGEFDRARSDLDYAVAMNRKVGALPAVARVLADRAAMEFDSGHPGTGYAYAQESLRVCERLRMRRLGRKVSRMRDSGGAP